MKAPTTQCNGGIYLLCGWTSTLSTLILSCQTLKEMLTPCQVCKMNHCFNKYFLLLLKSMSSDIYFVYTIPVSYWGKRGRYRQAAFMLLLACRPILAVWYYISCFIFFMFHMFSPELATAHLPQRLIIKEQVTNTFYFVSHTFHHSYTVTCPENPFIQVWPGCFYSPGKIWYCVKMISLTLWHWLLLAGSIHHSYPTFWHRHHPYLFYKELD